MAHFARIEDGIVQEVIVISNSDAPDPYPESETLGQAFIASLNIEGEWIQTSYNGSFRAHYAGVGFTYDKSNDVFYSPQPFPSWSLNNNWDWEPPVPMPDDPSYVYYWDEDTVSWIGILRPVKPQVEILGD